VVLLLQGRVEYVVPHYASRALFGSLLAAGIRIEEYQRSFLHAKVAVFDSRQACVGSSNIDPYSLLLAREANVFVDDGSFAAELRTSLEEAMRGGARALRRQAWTREPIWRRAWVWIAYGIARLLIGFASYERYH
jgi:cardiolipin synthase